jgi:hypothetical protein
MKTLALLTLALAVTAFAHAAESAPSDPNKFTPEWDRTTLGFSNYGPEKTTTAHYITIEKTFSTRIQVGDAVLTRVSVLAVIETLTNVRDKTLPALRYSYSEQVRRASAIGGPEMVAFLERVSAGFRADLAKQATDLTAQIAELQKLADGLAVEKSK